MLLEEAKLEFSKVMAEERKKLQGGLMEWYLRASEDFESLSVSKLS